MRQKTHRDRTEEVKRRLTKLSLSKETLRNMTDPVPREAAHKSTYAWTGTCIITGHPCPPPCG